MKPLDRSRRQLPPLPVFLILSFLGTTGQLGCNNRSMQQLDLVESFGGDSFDRSRWRIAKPDPVVGTVEIKDEALLISAPAAPEPRAQIRNIGKFAFDGDFEVSMDFELLSELPDPEKDYINLELILFGGDGHAHLSRVNHKGAGNGCVAYFAPNSDSGKSIWQHYPTTGDRGTLIMTRSGEELSFLVSDDTGGEPKEIAKARFGLAPVKELAIALSVSTPTNRPFQVRVDNVRVHSRPRPLSLTTNVGVWIAAAVLILLAGLGTWLWMLDNRRAPTQTTGRHAPVRKTKPARHGGSTPT